jgi:hypothetical protein
MDAPRCLAPDAHPPPFLPLQFVAVPGWNVDLHAPDGPKDVLPSPETVLAKPHKTEGAGEEA